MTIQRILWSYLFLPLTCALAGYLLVQGIEARSDYLWREQQSVAAVEEAKFVTQILRDRAVSVDPSAKELARGESGDVRILSDTDVTERERATMKSSRLQWLEEPDGYYRLRVAREVYRPPEPLHWVILNKRLPPRQPLPTFLRHGLVWLFACVGCLVAFLQNRRRKKVTDTIRALQLLRSQTKQPMARTEFLAMIPDGAISDEISKQLMSLLDSYHQNYYSIHTGKGQAETVLAAMPVGILAFTSDLKLWFANRAGSDMLDLQTRVKDKSTLVEVIRNPRILELISDSQRNLQAMDLELEMASPATVLRVRATPLSHASFSAPPGSPPPMLLVVTDETRLRQLENYRRDFTANVSHELKTPLAAIKAYAETLLMGALEEPDARERFVQRISDQASRLEDLIMDVLRLTRLQALPEKIALAPIMLSEVVRTLVEEQQPIARSRNVKLVNQVWDDTIRVMAEHESLRTIIGNLLSNAIRYSKPNGHVLIVASVDVDVVQLSVIDGGIGIAEADLDRIFERFYTVDKARTKGTAGTGLGLSIVKHLTAAIGGTIHVQSKLGEGSEFHLRLRRGFEGMDGSVPMSATSD
ncbi:MAG: ATP-binding protein [Planctomycetota bacterium]